jgi:hypothetical protein
MQINIKNLYFSIETANTSAFKGTYTLTKFVRLGLDV